LLRSTTVRYHDRELSRIIRRVAVSVDAAGPTGYDRVVAMLAAVAEPFLSLSKRHTGRVDAGLESEMFPL
jgi:hypothetical protein